MRKFLITLFALILSLSILTACGGTIPETNDPTNSQTPETPGDETPETPGDETPETPGDETPETPGDKTPETPGDETPETPDGYKNTAFNSDEIEVLNKYIGETIPYLANNSYTFVGYTTLTDYEHGVRFTTVGNTEDEFFAYVDALTGYYCVSTEVDDNGVTVYTYEKDKTVIELSYVGEGETAEIRFVITSALSVGMGYTKTEFTADEIALFESFMGKAIPFAPTNEYYVQDFVYDYDTIGYYTIGNTLGDFNNYRASLTDYSANGMYEDSYGNTWYIYKSGEYALEISYCTYDDGDDAVYMIYVYAYPSPYTDFSGYERDMFIENFGTVIPFRPCEEFYVDESYLESQGMIEVIFLVDDISEFSAYRRQFTDYEFINSYQDDYGDTCYVFRKGDVEVDMSCFWYDGYDSYVIDVYVYISNSEGGDTPSGETYTDFEAEEKELLEGYFGFVVPFMENTGYGIDDYMSTNEYLNFYFMVADETALDTYLALLTDFTYVDQYVDDNGNTCYIYAKDDVEIDVTCYYYEYASSYLIDMYIYFADSEGGDAGDTPIDEPFTEFEAEDKALLENYFGFTVPFMETVGYAVEDYMGTEYELVNFYFIVDGMTSLDDYRKLFADYEFIESYVDEEFGDTCYVYRKGNVEIDMTCYYYDEAGSYLIDVYIYLVESDEGGDSGDTPPVGVITDFTDEEKAIFEKHFGFVIPFIDSEVYYVDDCMSSYEFVCFYAWDLTAADFEFYRSEFSNYEFIKTYTDDNGVTWYIYERDGVYVDMAYYYNSDDGFEGYLLEVFVYYPEDAGDDTPDEKTYTDFTDEEKALLESYFGLVVPFMETDSYMLYDEMAQRNCMIYYFTVDSETALEEYLNLLVGYTKFKEYESTAGDIRYVYRNGETELDICFFWSEPNGCYYINIYIYYAGAADDGPIGMVTDFTDEQIALFEKYFGFVVPFLSCEDYYVEDLMATQGCVSFYIWNVTEQSYEKYRALYADYEFIGVQTEENGITSYTYERDGVRVSMAHYLYEEANRYILDIYIYYAEDGGDTPDEPETFEDVVFDFGDNGSAAHQDGNDIGSSKTYTSGDYKLVITNASKVYDGGFDAKGNSILKLGSSKAIGTITFVVPDDVMTVVIYAARYKSNADNNKIVINGITYTLTKNSNDGEYEAITVDTSTNKTVVVSTTTSGVSAPRCVINTIVFMFEVNGTPDEPVTPDEPSGDVYTDYEAEDKALLENYFGFAIPFMTTEGYYIDDYMDAEYELVNFYFLAHSMSSLDDYRKLFADYEFIESYVDEEFGDTCYVYRKDGVEVDMTCYYSDEAGSYLIDVYIYLVDSDEGGSVIPDDNGLLSNKDAGLPADDGDGVYDVNFDDASNVKDVTDLYSYVDGCPTEGNVPVLVIPVQFTDAMASSKGYKLSNVYNAFKGVSGTTDYFSVYEYYYISSYGKLNLEFTILDEWYTASQRSSYYANKYISYYGENVWGGDQILIDEVLAYLEDKMDLSKFDSDNNGFIDAIVIINTLDVNSNTDMQWAYRFWNIYLDSNNAPFEYDGVSANDYMWASYGFLFEDEYHNYTNKNGMNTSTFIHEFGHVLGSSDYYNTTTGDTDVMGGYDIMDDMTGDHNAFTKFNYGWLDESRLITTSTTVTLTLEAFSKNGDTIIIANNWDPTLGAYQEYYVIMYYTNDGLNDGEYGYFADEGIVVYHINATLVAEKEGGVIYYDIYNNNSSPSSDGYGTKDNLVEYVLNGGSYVYGEGDSLPTVTDDNGEKLDYTFTVVSITDEYVTITFEFIG